MKYFDAFAGIGGFALPLSEAGNQCVGFSEIDEHATQVYLSHFPSHTPYGDITAIDALRLPDFDLLCGGFPCQAFSVSGERGGFADSRGTLFFDLCRIVEAKQPRLLLLENVKGLLSHDDGSTFGTILAALDELGYNLQWQVCNGTDFGVPQNRERVFLLGHRRDTPRPEVFPLTGTSRPDHEACQGRRCVLRWQNKRAGAVLDTVAPTLRASGGTDIRKRFVVVDPAGRLRFPTPVECERLQGFPDQWTKGISDTARYKALGNAVTVNVVREIVSRLSA